MKIFNRKQSKQTNLVDFFNEISNSLKKRLGDKNERNKYDNVIFLTSTKDGSLDDSVAVGHLCAGRSDTLATLLHSACRENEDFKQIVLSVSEEILTKELFGKNSKEIKQKIIDDGIPEELRRIIENKLNGQNSSSLKNNFNADFDELDEF